MSLPLPSSVSVSELLHDVRVQLSLRGHHSLRVLQEAFEVNGAAPPAGVVDCALLEAVLGKCGVFLRQQQLHALFRHLDQDSRGRVLTGDVLEAVQGSVSARRHRLLVLVYRSLDVHASGLVPLATVLSSFDGRAHPAVLDGSRSVSQVEAELRAAFRGASASLSLAEFVDRYASISALVPLDDDFFAAYLERCWHVLEPKGDARLQLLSRVRHVLRERTRARDSGPRAESEKLRLYLKWWDLEESGCVSFPQFHGALQRFGLVLDDTSVQQLFDLFDAEGAGRIRYAEFVAVLYEEDLVNTYYSQRQQRDMQQQQQQAQPEEKQRSYTETERVLIAAQQPTRKALPVDISASPASVSSSTAFSSTSAPGPAVSSSSLRPVALFVLGGPGSGKGTQCARIVQEFGFVHLSTGDLLRAEQGKADSDLAPLIAACISEGRLVPVTLIVQLLDRAIAAALKEGRRYFLVDGFPRAVDQKAAWDELLGSKRGLAVPFILYFDCPLSVLEQRLLSRGQSSGRADDNLEAIKKRFVTFEQESRPVVQLFADEGRARLIDGTETPEQVYGKVRRLVSSVVA